jgi:TPR repeat protein
VFVVFIPLGFAHSNGLSHPSPSPNEPLGHITPAEEYENALRSLERYSGASRSTSHPSLSGYLLDSLLSFFTYKSPVVHTLKEVGYVNGVWYSNQDLYDAVVHLRRAADGGNSDAIYTLADMNFFGNYSHPRNISEAVERYTQLASTTGNSSAQHMLGFIYSTGFGEMPQNPPKGLTYYSFAADQGNERSQMVLGYRNALGIGTPQDCDLAVEN